VQRAAFASNVVGRLCRRGHAALVAAALWDDLGAEPSCQAQQADALTSCSASGGSGAEHGQQRSRAARAVVAGVQHRAALDRLLEALLRHLDAARWPLVTDLPMPARRFSPPVPTASATFAEAKRPAGSALKIGFAFKFGGKGKQGSTAATGSRGSTDQDDGRGGSTKSSETVPSAASPASGPQAEETSRSPGGGAVRSDVDQLERPPSQMPSHPTGMTDDHPSGSTQPAEDMLADGLPDPESGYGPAAAAVAAMVRVDLWARPAVRYLLTERLPLQRVLPVQALHFLVALLSHLPPASPASGDQTRALSAQLPTDLPVSQHASELDGRTGQPAAARDCEMQDASNLVEDDMQDAGGMGTSGGRKGCTSALSVTALRAAQLWGDSGTLTRLPPPAQACLTEVLGASVVQLGRNQIEVAPTLLPVLLQGVGNRLSSPDPVIRRQGMRLGSLFSKVLDPEKPPLFGGASDGIPNGDGTRTPFDLGLLPQERWEAGSAGQPAAGQTIPLDSRETRAIVSATGLKARSSPAKPQTPASHPAAAAIAARRKQGLQRHASSAGGGEGGGVGPDTETDSDDDLQPYDLSEGEQEEVKETGAPFQLRDVAAALRKGDDTNAVLKALQQAGPLIAAAPDELNHYAGEMARALLYTRVPEWADVEPGDVKPSDQRVGSLVALLVAAPQAAGAALLPHFTGSHLDTGQRLLVLDAMGTAAEGLAVGGLPALKAGVSFAALDAAARTAGAMDQETKEGPRQSGQLLQGNNRGEEIVRQPEGDVSDSVSGEARQMMGGATRRWGLRAAAARSAAAPRTFRNLFAPVAKQWLAGLLEELDVPRQGVDLLGRDSLLLGQLLGTVGRFTKAAAPAPEAAELADTAAALLQLPAVAGHPEPHVRRNALFAATQIMAVMSPARVAGALAGAAAGNVHDGALIARLESIRVWTEALATSDPDDQCRRLAAAARSLQARLGSEATEAVDGGAYQLHPVPVGGGLLGGLLPNSATVPLGGSGRGRSAGPLGEVLTKLPEGVLSSDGGQLPSLLGAGHGMEGLRLC